MEDTGKEKKKKKTHQAQFSRTAVGFA